MLIINAINDMLAYLGESPIDPTDPDYTRHSLYASAVRVLNTTSEAVQSEGWWFNSRTRVTLAPVANAITLPADVLTLEVLRVYGDTHDYTIRDGALFDLTDNTATITRSVIANIRSLVEFEDLPATAAHYIAARAAVRFVKTYDGDALKIKSVEQDAQALYIPFHSDHIRNARVNMFTNASISRILANNWYSRYQQR